MKKILLSAFISLTYCLVSFGQGTNCSNAITLPLDGNCYTYSQSSTIGGTNFCSGGQGWGGNGRVTYFKFTTNNTPQCVSIDITTSVVGTNIEAILYTGCVGTAVTGGDGWQSVCMTEGSGIWATNLWQSNLSPNTTYYLRVRTEQGYSGTLQICSKFDTPTNNLCSGATGIDTLTTTNQNNACNSGSTEVPPANLCAGSLENTAWYTFTVLTTGVSSIVISNLNCVNVNFTGGNPAEDYGFQIGFFTGNCGGLTPTNCIAQAGSAGGTIIASSSSLPAGTVVHVAIDGLAGSNCEYSIVAINAAPLSVKMKSFEGWKGIDYNLLTWVTSTETNNQYFEIQRSLDGNNYSTLGRIEGSLNSSVEKRYSYKDNEPLYIGYYRLKQVDASGNTTYSRVVRIIRPVTATLTARFENPVHDVLKASLQTSEAGAARVQIVDVTGKTMLTGSIQLQKGNNQYISDLGKLTPGTYYLVITKDDTRKTFPFIKY
jgi:hypothetical protein